jgi:hypothetical protein
MSFEQMLREHMQHEADAVVLPMRDPDQAIDRARTRRRRRVGRTAAAGLAVAMVAAVALPPMLRDADDDVSVASGGAAGLVPTGPLDMDWRPADGGLSNVYTSFQSDDGTVYALSTGPGARLADQPGGDDVPQALYRLADDGSWEPVALDGDDPQAIDVAGGDGLLYAVSTGPGSGGEGIAFRLSTSADGGETWSSEQIEPAEPPSTVVPWLSNQHMAVENNGSTTLALVTTSFEPDLLSLFPELNGNEAGDFAVVIGDEGLVLWHSPPVEQDGAATRPTTAPQPSGAETETTEAVSESEVEAGEVIRTVPWADLGVDGRAALANTQLFRWADGAWQPVDGGAEPLTGLGAAELQVAGDRFVATGYSGADAEPVALSSADGASWTPVSAPAAGWPVLGVGTALVRVPYEGRVLHVSGDGGVTWSEVDLAAAGIGEDAMVVSADGGPLGLALVVDHADGGQRELVVTGDLIDWTTTPLADVTGLDATGEVTTMVGEDRIVVSASEALDGGSEPPASVTVVGTPVRTP